MSFIDKIIGGGAATIIDSVSGAIDKFIQTPEEKQKLQADLQIEINRHFEAMQNSANAELDITLKDLSNARETNTRIQESANASWLSKNTGYMLDIFLGLIWGISTIFIIAKALKVLNVQADMTAILSMYATITAVFMSTVQFHRGTTKGSEDKQRQIHSMINK